MSTDVIIALLKLYPTNELQCRLQQEKKEKTELHLRDAECSVWPLNIYQVLWNVLVGLGH